MIGLNFNINPQYVLAIGLFTNVIGSLLLAKPLIKSKELIKSISTYEDTGAAFDMGTVKKTNYELKRSLEKDNLYGRFGITLLVIGFTIQLIFIFL